MVTINLEEGDISFGQVGEQPMGGGSGFSSSFFEGGAPDWNMIILSLKSWVILEDILCNRQTKSSTVNII